MQEKNAMDLIQQLKDFFKHEYGLNVHVEIMSFSPDNSKDFAGLMAIAESVHKQVGGSIKTHYDEGRRWIKVDSFDKGTSLSFFCKEV